MIEHDWDKIGTVSHSQPRFWQKIQKDGSFSSNPGTLTFRVYGAGKCRIVDNIALQMLAPSLKIELALILYWSDCSRLKLSQLNWRDCCERQRCLIPNRRESCPLTRDAHCPRLTTEL